MSVALVPFLVTMIAGFAGSFHCVGMCGGFACGLAQTRRDSGARLLHSFFYNIGRVVTYAFIGALAGLAGTALIGSEPLAGGGVDQGAHGMNHGSAMSVPMGMVLAGEMGLTQRLLSVLAGLLMLVMALELLGLRRRVPSSWARLGGERFARTFRTLLLSKRPSAALITLGVANGFLPCPLCSPSQPRQRRPAPSPSSS